MLNAMRKVEESYDMKNTSNNIQGAWGVIGDFNVITFSEEKRVVEATKWRKS